AFAIILFQVLKPRQSTPISQEHPKPISEHPQTVRQRLRRQMHGLPFEYSSEPVPDFMLLPQQYYVDLTVPLPYVEVRFYALTFFPRPITLGQLKLSLRLFPSAALENISFINEDFEVHPKDAPMVYCRRNLTDSETKNLPWRDGHDTASFELVAKALDDD